GSAAAQGTGSRGAEDLVSLRRAAEEGSVAPGAGDPPQRPPGTLPRGRCRNGPPRETSRRRGRRRAEDPCSDRTGPDPDIARQIAREIYGRGVELEVWVQLGSLCGTLVATSRGFQRSRCHERKVTPLRFACPGPVSGQGVHFPCASFQPPVSRRSTFVRRTLARIGRPVRASVNSSVRV